MVLGPNNDRGHKIDVILGKGQEYQAVRIFGKDSLFFNPEIGPCQKYLTCRVGFFLHDLSEISYKLISPYPLTRSVLITVMNGAKLSP
jgi:hypothetical protein